MSKRNALKAIARLYGNRGPTDELRRVYSAYLKNETQRAEAPATANQPGVDATANAVSDIIARLNTACVGHPHARIPWPHRLLHDAADEITQLRAQLDESRMQALADFGQHQTALDEVAALHTAVTAITEATTLLEAARIAREAITSADPRMPRSQTPHPPQPAPDRPGCGG